MSCTSPIPSRRPTRHPYSSTLLLGAFLLAGSLAAGAAAQPGTVKAHQKISDTAGGFAGVLDDNDSFGFSVAALGDVDGDGVDDLAVGAVGDGDGGAFRGAVYVLFMNADGTVRDEQKISATAGGFTGTLDDADLFGGSVTGLGDVDGDGVLDLAVGAYLDDDGGSFDDANVGSVWVLFLNADGTVKGHQKISATEGGFTGAIGNLDNFGRSVAGLGDLDGDGVEDLAVGAFFDGEVFSSEGAVYVLFLNADGTVKGHQKIGHTVGGFGGALSTGDQFGASVTVLGDLDGDGVVDLAVGANRADDGGTGVNPGVGAVWVLFMNADGTVRDEQKISATAGGFTGDLDNGDLFGRAVAGLGDVDGDGVVDLAVGADRDDDGGENVGAAWVLLMNTDGTVKAHQKISATAGGFTGSLNEHESFGFSLASLGDLDGDGTPDLAVGVVDDSDGGVRRGAVYALFLDGLSDLILTGVIDGPLTGGTPKAIEVYVRGNVADLSAYGLGSANNGGGSDGVEFTFPAVAASAGDVLYVATESAQFTSWFGFPPDYTSSAVSINGDDAVELFRDGVVVDVFGEIGVSGSGQPWEYTDGWAYRVDGTGPDGSAFVLSNWTFSGPNALDGETANTTAGTPFPSASYSPTAGMDDTTPPSCLVVGFRLDPLPRTLNFFLEDTESGVASVEVTGSTTNAVVEIPEGSGNFFNAGDIVSFGPPEDLGFDVQATQTASSATSNVELTVTDAAGNAATCSAALPADEVSSCPADLVISDFQAAPDAAEFIDLQNVGATTIDFSAVTCVVGAFTSTSYLGLPASGTLAPGGTLRFGASGATDVDVSFADGALRDGYSGLALLDREALPDGTTISTVQPDIVTSLVYLSGGTVYGFFHADPANAPLYCGLYAGELHPYGQSLCTGGAARGSGEGVSGSPAALDFASMVEAAGVEQARSGADAGVPTVFALRTVYPNPLRDQAMVAYEVPEVVAVRIVVYDVLGRAVTVLVDEAAEAGRYEASFDASGLASGTYVVRMMAGTFAQTQRFTVVR